MFKGIDVSEHQRVIDWNTVKSQVDFTVLRVGYGSDITSQDDSKFKRNADECTRLGIPFGVYLYSYANSIDKAKSEAQHVLRLIKGYKLSYPVYYDLEDLNTTGKCSKNLIANMAEAFCNVIEAAGYWAGIYANTYWFNTKLTDPRFSKWTKWVAEYNTRCNYSQKHDIWQYSSTGRINGIRGNVDMNYSYISFPDLINSKKTNNNKEEEKKVENIVIYNYGTDLHSAEILADYLNCPTISNSRKFDYSCVQNVYAVGGTKGQYTSYLTKLISGKNRYDTCQAVLNYINKR